MCENREMFREIAALHVLALPHTFSSRLGVGFVALLYRAVSLFGDVKTKRVDGRVVGVISSVGSIILTLCVHPEFQHRGIGRELVNFKTGKCYVYTEDCTVEFYKKMKFREIIKVGKIVILRRG